MFVKQLKIIGSVALVLAIFGFSFSGLGDDTPSVFVSIIPQKYFAQKISGDLIDIHIMVPKGANPATYEPKPRQMTDLSKATIYFAIGVPFESVWLEKFKAIHPGMEIVHTENGIEKMEMARHHDHDHHHGVSHENAAEVKDPHVWTSPVLVKIISKNMYQAMARTWPDHKDIFADHYQQFIEEIDLLDQDLKTLFQSCENKSFMVFHPAWGYFAKAYGLHQLPIEMEGKDPKPAQLVSIIEAAKANNIHTIFVQPQFSTQNAVVIARAIKGQVVVADPLANDWEKNLRQQAQAFKAIWE